MRTLFLLLVLANAAFYAYAYVARERDAVRRSGPELQINADKIRIVRRPEAAAAPAACLEWGVLTGDDVARASAALAQLALPQASVQRTMTEAPGYWVYMPPLKADAAVEKKLQELRALGVTVETGKFAADMHVTLTNDGPATFIVDSGAGMRNE